MKVVDLSGAMLDELVEHADRAPRGRQHQNLHGNHDAPVQRLFNAIGMDSYIRPHRHWHDPKTETLLAIRGSLTFVTFNDEGVVTDAIRLGEQVAGSTANVSIGVEVPPGVWHTLIADEPGAIVFEVKSGPFDPSKAKEFGAWSPVEGSDEAQAYLTALRQQVAAFR
jgi:cupin fold WbuC family metalloprotein